jgi:hypothetical protein
MRRMVDNPRQLLVLVLVALAGCADRSDGEPAAQLVSYVGALSGGGIAGVHPLLEPALQDDIATLHATLKRSAAVVRERLPAADQKAVLERIRASLAESTATPAEFFAALVAAGDGFGIERLAQWGARPLSQSEEGDRVIIETLAGDRFAFRRAPDGSWRIVAPDAFAEAIREAAATAQANLEQLERDLERREALRTGRVIQVQ